jgi:hypothetical protein
VRVSATESKLLTRALDIDGDGRVGLVDTVGYIWYSFKVLVGWYKNRNRVKIICAALLWTGLGVVYGMAIEEWDFVVALYFAVSALSTGGLQTPTCIGENVFECNLGNLRAIYCGGCCQLTHSYLTLTLLFLLIHHLHTGMYILVGVPLYACAMGQFAGLLLYFI